MVLEETVREGETLHAKAIELAICYREDKPLEELRKGARVMRGDGRRRLVKQGKGWLVMLDPRDERRVSPEDEVKRKVRQRTSIATGAEHRCVVRSSSRESVRRSGRSIEKRMRLLGVVFSSEKAPIRPDMDTKKYVLILRSIGYSSHALHFSIWFGKFFCVAR